MRRLVAVGAVGVLVATPFLLHGGSAKPKPETPTTGQVARWVNKQRVRRGLPSLRPTRPLVASARRWSRYLARTGTLAHTRLSLRGGFTWMAETLYRGPGGPVGPWLRSPPHRAIVLSPKARLAGIGRSGNVWVGRFAAR